MDPFAGAGTADIENGLMDGKWGRRGWDGESGQYTRPSSPPRQIDG